MTEGRGWRGEGTGGEDEFFITLKNTEFRSQGSGEKMHLRMKAVIRTGWNPTGLEIWMVPSLESTCLYH